MVATAFLSRANYLAPLLIWRCGATISAFM